jgi:hypothetical protein
VKLHERWWEDVSAVGHAVQAVCGVRTAVLCLQRTGCRAVGGAGADAGALHAADAYDLVAQLT